jgi:hypothetical protein
MSTPLCEALAKPQRVPFGDHELLIHPLDFNDMAEIEEKAGVTMDDLDLLAFLKPVRHQRFFFWLALRKADPNLTRDERARGEYKMTEREAGFILKSSSSPQQNALMNAIFQLSGLTKTDGTEPEAGEGPAEAKTPSASAA